MTVTIYGLKTCDTCRKARRALPDARFVDVREADDLAARLPRWHEAAGARLLNKASTTWRCLSDTEKARANEDLVGLLLAHPALIKRPVIERGDEVFVGWTPQIRTAHGITG